MYLNNIQIQTYIISKYEITKLKNVINIYKNTFTFFSYIFLTNFFSPLVTWVIGFA